MSDFITRLKREILGAIPTVVYFFVVFQLLALTRALILKSFDIEISTFLNATIAAMIVGKVVLVADLLPFINRFPDKPLIYNTVWKTSIYVVAALIILYLERLIPLILEQKSLGVANSRLLDEVIWPHFWLVQIWLLVCIFMYCTLRELGQFLGPEHVRSMFFGQRSKVA